MKMYSTFSNSKQKDGKKWELQSIDKERDLRVIISDDLKVSRQCVNAASNANKLIRY